MKSDKEIIGVLCLGMVMAGLLVVQSCKKDDDDAAPSCTKEVADSKLNAPNKDKLTSDSLLIVQYLADHEIDIETTEIKNKVRYHISELGTGETPCLENYIKVKYRGTLMKTGYIFDPDQEQSSEVNWQERESTFNLNSLITGWQIVLPTVPVGTKLTLYIPSGYGYGVNGGGNGTIPVNANLVFDIELLEIVQ